MPNEEIEQNFDSASDTEYVFGNTAPITLDLADVASSIEEAFTSLIELEIFETERDIQDIEILLNRESGQTLGTVSVATDTVLLALMDSIGIE